MSSLTTYTYASSEYFLNYELLNKYKVFNMFLVPKFEKVSLMVSVLDILNASLNPTSAVKFLEIKLYVLLYILFSRAPLVCLNNVILSKKGKVTSFSYYLKVLLVDSASISEFFISIFFENWHKVKKEGSLIPLVKDIKSVDIKTYFNNIFYRFKIFTSSVDFFRSLSYIFNLIFDFKDVFFSITLCLSHPINILKTSGIRSFPFFWIND